MLAALRNVGSSIFNTVDQADTISEISSSSAWTMNSAPEVIKIETERKRPLSESSDKKPLPPQPRPAPTLRQNARYLFVA